MSANVVTRLQGIKRSGELVHVVIDPHGAGPESSSRIDLSIIQPILRPTRFRRAEHRQLPVLFEAANIACCLWFAQPVGLGFVLWLKQREPSLQRCNQPTPLPQRHGTRNLIELPGTTPFPSASKAMESPQLNLDPPVTRSPRIPQRSLPQDRPIGTDHTCLESHWNP